MFESISDIRATLETMEVLIQSEEEEVKGGIVLYIAKELNSKTELRILEYESDDINCLEIVKSLDELYDYISKHKLKIDDIITNQKTMSFKVTQEMIDNKCF